MAERDLARRAAPEEPPVGTLLRIWRQRRRYSQLALALEAGISARHLSFVETGRARASREMLLHLAERLEIPLRERNALLIAGGYAPEYRERRLDDAALRELRETVELLLSALEPCPALAVGRHWTLVAHNRALAPMLAGLAPALLEPPANVLRASLHPDGLAPRIVNLVEWRAHILDRLRRDADRTADPVLGELLDELRDYPVPRAAAGPRAAPHRPGTGEEPSSFLAIPMRLATDAGVLSFISTTTVFGTAVDVAASELVIESFLPADAETRRALEAMAAAAPAAP